MYTQININYYSFSADLDLMLLCRSVKSWCYENDNNSEAYVFVMALSNASTRKEAGKQERKESLQKEFFLKKFSIKKRRKQRKGNRFASFFPRILPPFLLSSFIPPFSFRYLSFLSCCVSMI